MTPRLPFGALLAAATALVLVACGGSDGGGNPAPPLPPPPLPMIGPAGGMVAGPNGAQVVVPAGALAANTAIAVDQSNAGSPALPAGLSSFGAMYAFTPHGTTFVAPVTITVPFSAASVPAGATPALFKTNAAGAWEPVANATVNAGTITAQVTSFSFLIVGTSPPQITTQPADRGVTEPATATFAVTAIGFYPPFTYQWQKSDDAGATFTDIGGATASSYTTGATTIAADNADRYRVLVSSFGGTATSAAATLTVSATIIAPTITTQPQSVSVNAGANASFTMVATGSNLVYQWHRNGVAISGQTNASLNLVNVQVSDAGNYTVVVSNLVNGVAINSVTSNTATLTVTTPPAATGARIAAGSDFSFARLANGNLVSWGSDASGTLGAGIGDQSRNAPGPALLTNVISIAAGGSHGLAVVGNGGGIRGWGYNGFGQLGDGTNVSRETPVTPPSNYPDAVEFCGGTLHSLFRRSSGSLGTLGVNVYAMGSNAFGQLGDGSNTERRFAGPVSGMTTAIAIACRGNHSLALLADGTVRAWGSNSAGQLGDGTTTDRSTPVAVSGLTNVIAIAAGNEHSLAVRSDGSVWAWGSNVNGKLGDGTTVNRLTPTATLLTSGITAIAAGHMNSLALRGADGVVLSWGINETGQLGSGSLSPGFRPQPAPVINLSTVGAIAFGSGGLGHGLAVLADGTVWSWGNNQMGTNNSGNPIFGRLGNGSTVPFSATPVQVTGLNLN